MLAQSFEDDIFLSRVTVHRSLLEATMHVPRDSFDPQFGLSSIEGRPNYVTEPNS
jgi:hypothetical protein